MHTIDIGGLEFVVTHPASLTDEELVAAQALDARALQAALPDRSVEEIALATGDDTERYIAGRRDPNTEVGRRYSSNQLYADPLMALALDGRRVVGEAFSANNTSGPTEIIRQQKMDAALPLHSWDWHGMIAVDPSYRSRGIATVLSGLLVAERRVLQPISAFAWSVPHVGSLLLAGGLKPHGEAGAVKPFGEHAEPISQQWYVGRVAVARARLSISPEVRSAMRYARRSARQNAR